MEDDILEKSCVIYLLINLINGKKYVGQTRKKLKVRLYRHQNNPNGYIGRAIQKYGWENFKFEILEECATPEELNAAEMKWIKILNTKAPNGYNLTDGGEGTLGYECSEKTRVKISENNPRKRAVRCLDTGEIFESAVAAAKHFNLLNSTICSVCRGQVIRTKGLKFEYVDQPLSEEERLREKKHHSTKEIRCIDTGEIFNTILAASKHFGISTASINRVCYGKCRHAKGFVFEFVDEQLRAVAELRKQKIYSHKKPVRCIETNRIYSSIKEAAQQTNIKNKSISQACKNKNCTAGGYHWKFAQ